MLSPPVSQGCQQRATLGGVGRLKQQKVTTSKLWRLEVRKRSAGLGSHRLPRGGCLLAAAQLQVPVARLTLASLPAAAPLLSPPVSLVFGIVPPSYQDISHMGLRANPTPVRPHLNLTNCICNDPIRKSGHSHRCRA